MPVYVFACPVCGRFEQSFGQTVSKLISSGEVAALSKFALAQANESDGKLDDAARLYSELAKLNSATVTAETANLRLAKVYEKQGKKKEAVDMLRGAADSEDILGKHPVSPGAFVPIREQLGTLLLEMGQPTEAQREFEAALKIYPGRFRGLYGAAQAAELAGDNQGASRYYTKLAAQTSKAGGSRDELNHVREFLSAQAKAADSHGVASTRE